ncbi:MAG: hypothetical protein L6Q81_07255 [Bacteroidia bacterium]|nr:hypothetical protein [Bacteroidia bacterium]
MKKLTALLLLLSGTLAAQSDTLRSHYQQNSVRDSSCGKQPCVKIISVTVSGGGQIYRTGFQDITLFREAAPSSSLAFADLSQHGNSMFSGLFGNLNSGTMKGVSVNLRFGCQKKFSETRFGIYHSTLGVSTQNYFYSDRIAIDTTPVPGGTLVTDSVFNSSYSFDWYSDVLAIEAAWIVRSNPARIISVHSGFGMFFGMAVNGTIQNSFVESSYLRHSGTGDVSTSYVTDFTTHTDIQERFRAPGLFFTSLNIPIGMNIRLGKRNPFLRHVVLHYEYQGQLQILVPSGMDVQLRTASGFNAGVKWMIHPPKNHHGGKGKHNHKHHE